jgi:hypothetical protein
LPTWELAVGECYARRQTEFEPNAQRISAWSRKIFFRTIDGQKNANIQTIEFSVRLYGMLWPFVSKYP